MSDLGDLGFEIDSIADVLATPQRGKVEIMQAVVYGFEAGTLSLLMRGQALDDVDIFPVGGFRFMATYKPQLGDTVWVLKNGADYIILGKVNPVNAVDETVFIGVNDGPPFLNNWSNFGSGFEPAQYYVDADGWVNFSGMIKRTTALSTTFGVITPMFVLPSDLWPSEDKRFTVIVDQGSFLTKSWILEVRTDGTFGMFGHTSMGNPHVWTSLENVRWMAGSHSVSRQHEWMPFHFHNAWGWDEGALPGMPPGEWVRWDGLVRLRGRIDSGSAANMCSVSPSAGRRRYNKMFRVVDGGLTPSGTRVDFSAWERMLRQPLTVLNEDLPLDGMQWLSRIPEESWTPIELLNGWSRHSNTSHWPEPGFFIDGYNVLHMRGLLTGGTTALGTIVARVPIGARPLNTRRFPAQHATGGTAATGSVDFDPATGNITITDNATGNTYLSLEEISYVVDLSGAA